MAVMSVHVNGISQRGTVEHRLRFDRPVFILGTLSAVEPLVVGILRLVLRGTLPQPVWHWFYLRKYTADLPGVVPTHSKDPLEVLLFVGFYSGFRSTRTCQKGVRIIIGITNNTWYPLIRLPYLVTSPNLDIFKDVLRRETRPKLQIKVRRTRHYICS